LVGRAQGNYKVMAARHVAAGERPCSTVVAGERRGGGSTSREEAVAWFANRGYGQDERMK
jgi:hypothetical protein